MAGDWIKMRVNLVTNPKVIALSEQISYSGEYQDWSGMHGFIPSIGGTKQDFDDGVMQALRVTRYVVVTALLRFWGYANEHAKDDFIKSLRISDVDEIVGVPGFGRALESVEWAEYDEELRGLRIPNFSEYNTSGHERSAEAKTAAQRQKEYRDRKKSESAVQNVVKTSDVTSEVTRNRREEKRREEVNQDSDKPTRKKSTPIPADFYPNENGVAYAEEKRVILAVELESFRNWHLAKGGTFKDWQACWRTWCDKAVEFGRAGKAPAASESGQPSLPEFMRGAL
ncbi:hypothetical protein [Quatrionicoccus australiensis]|uniref:hypothetical protein n=1 Tax=Quatrionicoccus australiensis TaxID=138118 RepID=UPI001CFB614C|nr:hypothetical protein [Quatrionicoccus australiensis]MCB4358454.1 hypothetical protein [Quatrionicoccus australiensis]